jgi:hypothetical protein
MPIFRAGMLVLFHDLAVLVWVINDQTAKTMFSKGVVVQYRLTSFPTSF